MAENALRFSLCIEPVFGDVDFVDRIALAQACGADAVEFWDPCARDLAAIGRAALPVAAMSLVKSWDVRLSDDYLRVANCFNDSVRVGKAAGCNHFIGLAGQQSEGADNQKAALIDNLSRLAELCEAQDAHILLEPLNSRYDHKGYFLDGAQDGFDVIRAVGSPRVKLLYDVYHMQLMEGNLVNTIMDNLDLIGHFHIAGAPGRHEPREGEINYRFVLDAIRRADYRGYVGLEYWPTYEHEQSIRDTLASLRGH